MRVMTEEGVLANCSAQGEHLRARLRELRRRIPRIKDVRGRGLLVGAELDGPGAPVVDACREAGLLINCTMEKTLRFSPPLIVAQDEIDRAVEITARVLGQ
jgi:acetylornithine aminotransferase